MSSDPVGGPICIELLLVFLCAWLTAGRTALEEISETHLRREEDDGDRQAGRLLSVKENEKRYQLALQSGTVILCLLAGVVAAYAFVPPLAAKLGEWFGETARGLRLWAMLISAALLALFMLVFGVVVPQRMAKQRPEKAARLTFPAVKLEEKLITPFTAPVRLLARGVLKLFGYRTDTDADEVTEDDILEMVDAGGETGAIEEAEKEMIENIFEFNNRTAEDVMTHRTDVTCIQVNDRQEKVIETIRKTGLSRFPVYDGDIDDIIGTLNARDYLLEIRKEHPRDVRGLLREAYFVPETVQADALFRDMQKKKIHMAIVADEYGGMAGVVTMEDLLEEIVGNIYDEFDPQAETEIVRISDNLWRISGQARLEDIEELLDVDLPESEDYDTLAGLVIDQLTTIPQDGSQPEMDIAGLHIHVDRLRKHRVESTLVSRIGQPQTEEDKA